MKCRVDVDESRLTEGWATLPRPVADLGRYSTIVWLVEWNQSWFCRNYCAEGSFSTSWKQARLSRYPVIDLDVFVEIHPSFTFSEVTFLCLTFLSLYSMHMYAFHIAESFAIGMLMNLLVYGSQASWVGKSQKRPKFVVYTFWVLCYLISCDLCQQIHARMPSFCQEKREKEKDAGTKSVLNCPSYGFCSLTWPWAVVRHLSPKVRRKLKTYIYFKYLHVLAPKTILKVFFVDETWWIKVR